MRHKSKTSDKFFHYKNFVEKQTNQQIKISRFDHGGEYKYDELNDFCQKEDIKRGFTTACTPQENGVSEHKNRFLINVVLTMLSYVKLPKVFWGEALLTTNYL